jgi:hypothetical protein
MKFEKTYKIVEGPPACKIEEYAVKKNHEYKHLLDTATSEKELQNFFELNPSFVPGAWTPSSKSGHYPMHCALITQPELRGISTKIPDFMWIAQHSLGWFPTLIEIENPNKKIFKKDGVPTAEFTQARNQLEKWRTWFSNPSNVQMFLEMYHVSDSMRNMMQMKLHMILIYGRREEFSQKPHLSKDRMSLTSHDLELMSYDRLTCDKELSDAITVRLDSNNQYEAVAIPSTFKLGPTLSDRLPYIQSINNVIQANNEISNERKKFLLERLPYWIRWETTEERGIIQSCDEE